MDCATKIDLLNTEEYYNKNQNILRYKYLKI